MKIAHYINLPGRGGIESLFLSLISTPQEGVEHVVLLKSDAAHEGLLSDVARFSQVLEGYGRIFGISVRKLPKIISFLHFSHFLSDIDVVISWSQMGVLPLLEFCNKNKIKFIHYEHGSAWLGRPKGSKLRYIRQVKHILCASKACQRMLVLHWGVEENRTGVLLNPLRPELLPSIEVSPKNLDQTRPLVLGTAGRLVSLKGHAVAITTVRILKDEGIDCRLKIAGTGPEEGVLRGWAKEQGVESLIDFCGFVENMGAFFNAIDIFLCPSYSETFGLVSLEAAAWGCPVVATRVDGLPETMCENKSGLLVPPVDDPATGPEPHKGQMPPVVYDPMLDQLAEIKKPSAIDLVKAIKKITLSPRSFLDFSQSSMRLRGDYCFSDYKISFYDYL